jgi:lysyl-tRNA synthetase class 1
MFQKPTAAKRLYFDVIPRTVDDYLGFLEAYPRQPWKERLGNPVWHIHAGAPPEPEVLTRDEAGQATISFAMLLNLVAVSNDENPSILWGFLRRHYPSASPETHPHLDSLVRYAVAYFRDFVAPKKRYREADDVERGVLTQISSKLSQLPANVSADQIQHSLYDIARPVPRYQDHSAKGATASRPGVSNEFFNMIYAVLLGEDRGPRLGSFIAIYGLDETRKLIHKALSGQLVSEGQTRSGSAGAVLSRRAEKLSDPSE